MQWFFTISREFFCCVILQKRKKRHGLRSRRNRGGFIDKFVLFQYNYVRRRKSRRAGGTRTRRLRMQHARNAGERRREDFRKGMVFHGTDNSGSAIYLRDDPAVSITAQPV